MGITPATSVDLFFREVLIDALQHEEVEATESTEWYLVGLLGDFSRNQITSEPLALKLGETEDGKRVKALKEVGDTSLYLTGFFARSLERGIVAADYYIGLGEAAYGELANRLSASSVAEVYEQLAANFPRFVDVLNNVCTQVNFGRSDVVELYEEWLRTRSDWIEQRLRKLGVIIGDGGGYVQ